MGHVLYNDTIHTLLNAAFVMGDQVEKEKERAQKEEVVTQMTEVMENELQCIICSELFIQVGRRRQSMNECPSGY